MARGEPLLPRKLAARRGSSCLFRTGSKRDASVTRHGTPIFANITAIATNPPRDVVIYDPLRRIPLKKYSVYAHHKPRRLRHDAAPTRQRGEFSLDFLLFSSTFLIDVAEQRPPRAHIIGKSWTTRRQIPRISSEADTSRG